MINVSNGMEWNGKGLVRRCVYSNMCVSLDWMVCASGRRERESWLVGWLVGTQNTKKVSHGVVAVGQSSTYGTDGTTIQDPEWMRKKDRDRIQW